MAKIDRNSRRELLYLLFFYIWKIKSVKSAGEIRLKRMVEWDESRGINADLADMYSKIDQEQKKISWYGRILVNENKAINSYLVNFD